MDFCRAFEHEAGEGDKVETNEGLGVALVVFREPPASRHPIHRFVRRLLYGVGEFADLGAIVDACASRWPKISTAI